ncbi:hypothetical protein CEXT_198531 [Caerostris extrusa]|uniref:Uncharacterized protein n=1 Tax=Caerostris extrusa TaxID=172846 RepID=A0AAV4XRI2_CAEEX|nr:hypothetical protein CEXT_198531 [Caerostris extrusa]
MEGALEECSPQTIYVLERLSFVSSSARTLRMVSNFQVNTAVQSHNRCYDDDHDVIIIIIATSSQYYRFYWCKNEENKILLNKKYQREVFLMKGPKNRRCSGS